VRDGDSDLLALLNEGLALTIADGTYARLQTKWLAPLQPGPVIPWAPLLGTALAALIVAGAVAWLWQRALRRKVVERTAELSAANARLAREIQERQTAEEALRRTSEELEAVFANMDLCIAVLDRRFNFVRVNHAYANAAQRAPASIVGQNHFALYPDAEGEAIFRLVLESGRPYSVSARPFVYPDQPSRGITFWDWTAAPLLDGTGSAEGVVLTLIEVTERERQRQAAQEADRRALAQLERRVHERTAELEAANQELRSFSYSVSHDLRGPLRAINGFSHAIEEDCGHALPPAVAEHLARIREATVRMNGLIDGLLKLSQVFHSDLQTGPVDLSVVAQQVVRQLHESEPQQPIETVIEEGLVVTGDATLLRVVLENLLGNAWKFSARSAAPRVTFGRAPHPDGDAFVVRDNGVGFDMAYAHKLFQPFERLHGAEGFAGTGIGLATVRRVIQRHGGTVWAEGIPGGGAAFFFTLQPTRVVIAGSEPWLIRDAMPV